MKPIIKIHIGEYFASREPAIIHTVLGSCVSVCLFDPVARIGGMNHILHSGEGMSSADESARYGINAMELLINEMMGLGVVRSRLAAKVFGGGNMFCFSENHQQGLRNTDFVLNFLKTDKIKLIAQNTGGRFSRKLYFCTDTSEVLLKKTTLRLHEELKQKNKKTSASVVKSTIQKEGDVTIF